MKDESCKNENVDINWKEKQRVISNSSKLQLQLNIPIEITEENKVKNIDNIMESTLQTDTMSTPQIKSLNFNSHIVKTYT
jgi:hypothetical protein